MDWIDLRSEAAEIEACHSDGVAAPLDDIAAFLARFIA